MTLLKNVTDEEIVKLAELGIIGKRLGEIHKRAEKGIIDREWVVGELQRILEGKLGSAEVQIAGWEDYYRCIGISLDPSTVLIPQKPNGLDRFLVIAKGITPQRAYDICGKNYHCWKFTDKSLDEIIVHSDRTSESGAYGVWVRERVEADEELKNLSANDLKKKGIPGITFVERMLYGDKYFKETGKHLDIKKITLCSGSRYSDGLVPIVIWYDDKLDVDWCLPDLCNDNLRSRSVVS